MPFENISVTVERVKGVCSKQDFYVFDRHIECLYRRYFTEIEEILTKNGFAGKPFISYEESKRKLRRELLGMKASIKVGWCVLKRHCDYLVEHQNYAEIFRLLECEKRCYYRLVTKLLR